MVGSLVAAACGDDDSGDGSTLTAERVATYYGLVPGTCLVYSFGANQSETAVVTIEEPEDRIYPGRADVIWRLVAPNFGDLVRYLEPRADGTIVLLHDESRPGGELVTRIYAGDGGVEPLFARLRPASGDTLDFAGTEFRTSNAKPSETIEADGTRNEDPPVEEHIWNVINEGVSIGLDPPYDQTFELTYRIAREQVTDTARINFVPDVGFVRLQDFTTAFGGTGNVYTLSDARICDVDGTCDGSPAACPAL